MVEFRELSLIGFMAGRSPALDDFGASQKFSSSASNSGIADIDDDVNEGFGKTEDENDAGVEEAEEAFLP
jgi:hypothetical protein